MSGRTDDGGRIGGDVELPGLRDLRLRRALSQADLAARSGVGQANLSRIEAGKQRARPSTARRLAEALGVEPAALMGVDEDGADPMAPADRDGGGR